MIRKGLLVVCLLLFSSQAFSLCNPKLSAGESEEFKESSDLFAHCMMIQGAIMIKRGETGRDNVIGKSLSICKTHLSDSAEILINAGCSKNDALKALLSSHRQSLDAIYSNAQSHFQQTNKLIGR